MLRSVIEFRFTMDKYSISNLVGEGSFGKVYKAIDKQNKTTVALKIISKVRLLMAI